MFNNPFQETLLIPVHAVARRNHKSIGNEGFHRYLNKVQRIKLADKVRLHQWSQGVFLVLYAWNAGPVDGTKIYRIISGYQKRVSIFNQTINRKFKGGHLIWTSSVGSF